MRILKINLENQPLILVEFNKSVLEFSDLSELETSNILSTDKMQRLISAINKALNSDLTSLDFRLK